MTALPPSHLEAETTIQRLLAQQDGMAKEIEWLRTWKDSLKLCPHCMGMVEPDDAVQHIARCEAKVAGVERLREENERLNRALAWAQQQLAKVAGPPTEGSPLRIVSGSYRVDP